MATTEVSSLVDQCYQLLAKTQSNVVWEILRQSATFYEWDHYPKGDVYDKDTHSQYYYHAHPPGDGKRWEEHGHFHLFIHKKGIPGTLSPQPLLPHQQDGNTSDLCHLCAISMDKLGKPIRLFTTNRWVTAEIWYNAEAMRQIVPCFSITHAWPSWPTNIWLTQLVQDYQEKIIELLIERDQVIEQWRQQYPDINVFEDRRLEVTSYFSLI